MALTIHGDKVRDLRRANGWNVRAFADVVGLSHGYVSKIENDLAAPSPEVMWDIANALGVPLAALTGDKRAFTAAKNAALRNPRSPRVKAVA